MAEHSSISWTDATWNCLAGCTRVSAGCDLCYAAELAAKRLKNHPTYKGLATVTRGGRSAFNGLVRYIPDRLAEPLRWQSGRRIFVNSMSDLFHEAVPEGVIDRVFTVMALAPRHTFQILTKRPARMQAYCAALKSARLAECVWLDAEGRPAFEGSRSLHYLARRPTVTIELPLRNVWLGVSCEDQGTAEERIPLLLKTPAAVRFISAEPLLGPIHLERACCACPWPGDAVHTRHLLHCPCARQPLPRNIPLDWVIVGGESGKSHREMNLAWAYSIALECQRSGVPLFTKQDSGTTPGKQGRLSNQMWSLKEFPVEIS